MTQQVALETLCYVEFARSSHIAQISTIYFDFLLWPRDEKLNELALLTYTSLLCVLLAGLVSNSACTAALCSLG